MKNQEVLDPIIDIVNTHLIGICENKSDDVKSILDSLSSLNKSLVDQLKKNTDKGKNLKQILEVNRDYQSQKIDQFIKTFYEKNTPLYTIPLEELYVQIDTYVQELPSKLSYEQNRDRYYKVAGDSLYIRSIKGTKRFFYKISTIPLHLRNGVLKMFKKPAARIPYWKYTLPLRLFTERFVKTIYLKHVDDELYQYSKGLVEILKKALDKEQQSNQRLIDFCFAESNDTAFPDLQLDLTAEKKQLTKLRKELSKHINSLVEKDTEQFDKHRLIAGTIEEPILFLNFKNRRGRQEYYKKCLIRNNIGWGNTAFGLFEDWKIDQEIFHLITQIHIEVFDLRTIFQNNTKEIVTLLDQSVSQVEEIKTNLISRLSTPKVDLKKEVRNVLNGLDKNLVHTSIIPAIDTIVSQNFIGSITQFELKIDAFINEIPDKKWLTKLVSYDVPLKNADFDSFSPHELISFRYLPELRESCSSMKSNNIRHVESFKQDIGNISSIISFNLNSILDSKEAKEDNKKQLILEGIERSKNKLDTIKQRLYSYEEEIYSAFKTVITQFIESTLELTNNENAFNLRIIVTKAKAIQRTQDVSKQVKNRSKLLYLKLSRKYKEQINVVNHMLIPWKRRFGILDTSKYIATELSDFLSEAYYKINSLPIVYQQLYRIQPLTEMSLFIGRSAELQRLNQAFQSWKDGKYAPTVIIGEKWSGHTTLINYFIKNYIGKTKLIYESRLVNIGSTEEFIVAWQKILKTDEIASLEDVIEIINSRHKNTIIVIENIQNYYLRKIKGFDSLNLFVKLISKTYRNVFWLCSANMYAWDYLNKTIEISNYFGYLIKMTAFTDDELRQLIMKKNNISGYKIVFQPAQRNVESKKFNNLDPAEKQFFLQNEFFNKLNEFAKGNISLALSYWLLSTKDISEDSIEINNFESPDLSFITKLNSEKVFLIYLLIMHDGLTLEQLSIVLKKPIEKMHLLVIMLLDDGILVERNGWFEVNPLIYRHSINMLKSKNLIY